MSNRVVGLSTYRQNVKWSRWNMTASLLGYDYIELVVAAGLGAVLLPPVISGIKEVEELDRFANKAHLDDIEEFQTGFNLLLKETESYVKLLVDPLAGIILAGGEDICPLIYGQLPEAYTKDWNLIRDIFDIALVKVAMANDIPILAICRGHQVLNVACGGTLMQDIYEDKGNSNHISSVGDDGFTTEVSVKKESLAGHCYLPNDRVKCFHHQAVDIVGTGLRVIATSSDGVIEAVEATNHKHVLGLQWHPEKTADNRPFINFAKAVMDI